MAASVHLEGNRIRNRQEPRRVTVLAWLRSLTGIRPATRSANRHLHTTRETSAVVSSVNHIHPFI